MSKKREVVREFFDIGGKIQPQATDMEAPVLGALMLDKEAFGVISEILVAESFYKEAHVIIFSTIKDLFNEQTPVDILSVTAALRKSKQLDDVGGAYYVTTLTNEVHAGINIEHYAKIIAQKFIQRELIRISNETVQDSFNDTGDPFDLLNKAEKSLVELRNNSIKTKERHISHSVSQAETEYFESNQIISGINGGKTDIYQLDEITSGFKPSQNIVIAGRPSMGKSALGVQIIKKNCIDDGKPMGLFSLEMSATQLTQRLIANVAQIDFGRLHAGKLTKDEFRAYLDATKRVKKAPIYIDDSAGLTSTEFKVRVNRMVSKYGIVGVVSDYVQLRRSETEKELRNVIIESTRTDKQVAKDNNIFVVELSQVGRSAEKNPGKRPMLSDLKESGSIEEDADIVILLYRPTYYDIKTDHTGESTDNKIEFIIAKNRNGETGSTWGYWYGDTQSFHSTPKITDTINGNSYEAKKEKERKKQIALPIETVTVDDLIDNGTPF